MTNLTTITAKPAPEETQSCWSCGTMRAAHFCEACGKVQPPAPVDYFTFFGLPRKLNLDRRRSGKRFLRVEPQAASRSQRPRRQPGTGVEPATKFPAQRRSSHLERPDQAHAISSATRRRGTGRAIEDAPRSRRAPAGRSRSRSFHPICLKKSSSSTCNSKNCAGRKRWARTIPP